MSTAEVLVLVLLIAVVGLLVWLLFNQRSSARGSAPAAAQAQGPQNAAPLVAAPSAAAEAELAQLRADLAQSEAALAQSKTALAQSKESLAQAHSDHAAREAELSVSAQDSEELLKLRQELDRAQQESADASAQTEQQTRQLARDTEQLASARAELDQQRLKLEDEATDLRQRTSQLTEREDRLNRRESRVDELATRLDARESDLGQQSTELGHRAESLDQQQTELHQQQEQLAGLSAERAHELVLQRAERGAEQEAAALVRQVEQDARRTADRQARDVITTAIVRLAADQTSDAVLTAVELPSDEMKGRIIGREGRNIRTFEQLTGVNILIDDTPELVLLSSFDPVRREVARLTLSSLVADGRIHPARIEEAYDRALDLIDEHIMDAADEALDQVGITDLDPELKPILGALRYRTSYGQNVLDHSIETGLLAGLMAAELQLDPTLARRAAFLHDIGKALTHEAEGSHAMVGADLLERHGETADVVHAVRAHHNEVEPQTVEALLTQAADAVSGSRPGARRESLESYVKRLEQVERIAQSHEGVDRVFAMQAGREVRVMVLPDLVDDDQARVLARDIADELHSEVTFPGQIRVTVIRESRATATAL